MFNFDEMKSNFNYVRNMVLRDTDINLEELEKVDENYKVTAGYITNRVYELRNSVSILKCVLITHIIADIMLIIFSLVDINITLR